MGIKRKRTGPSPTYPERWQELAKNPERFNEARAEYRLKNPNVGPVEAHRAVKEFVAGHQKKFGK